MNYDELCVNGNLWSCSIAMLKLPEAAFPSSFHRRRHLEATPATNISPGLGSQVLFARFRATALTWRSSWGRLLASIIPSWDWKMIQDGSEMSQELWNSNDFLELLKARYENSMTHKLLASQCFLMFYSFDVEMVKLNACHPGTKKRLKTCTRMIGPKQAQIWSCGRRVECSIKNGLKPPSLSKSP